MTRAVHWAQREDSRGVRTPSCRRYPKTGLWFARVIPQVTCKRCLKLIGAQQPSGATLICEAPTCGTCRSFECHPIGKSSCGSDKIDSIVDASEKACEFYEPSGAAGGHKTSSSTVQPESEKTARAAQDARKSHGAGRLRKSEQNRTGSVAIREPSAASEFSIAHLSPVAACPACGTAVDADDPLVAQHKAYVARLESMLCEIVEADDALNHSKDIPTELEELQRKARLDSAIEAARGGIGGTK